MPALITRAVERRSVWTFCRVLLTTVFWIPAVHDIADFRAAVAEMAAYGLHPAPVYAVAVAATLAFGSALVILDRALWLGAAVLAGFLLLTIPIAHPFWSAPAAERTLDLQLSLEHLSLCGGLLAAILTAHAHHSAAAPRRRSATLT